MYGIKMNTLERNIVRSFKKAKEDMRNIQDQIFELRKKQDEIMEMVLKKKEKVREVQKIKIVRPKTVSKRFVASKDGKKFHIPECPFAKNIKPKSRIVFKSKKAALNAGYKPDACINA